MTLRIKQLLSFLGESELPFEYYGDDFAEIHDYCQLNALKSEAITWAKNIENINPESFSQIKNVVLVTGEYVEELRDVNQIVCDNPKSVFFLTVKKFFIKQAEPFISNHAVVETEKVGKNVTIGHFTYICKDVEICDNVTIGNNVSIVCPCHIGHDSVIGNGCVIGGLGFGLCEDANGRQQRVPHTGGVWIGNYVEMDSNCCVDRGTISDTILEDYVKMDNMVHVAHNVHLSENVVVTAMTLFSGSVTVGKNGYLAPGAIILNQKTIGENSFVGIGAVVLKDVEPGKVVAGVPARVLRDK